MSQRRKKEDRTVPPKAPQNLQGGCVIQRRKKEDRTVPPKAPQNLQGGRVSQRRKKEDRTVPPKAPQNLQGGCVIQRRKKEDSAAQPTESNKSENAASRLKPTESNKRNVLRLNKFLARQAGLSRRQADEVIKKGQVFVNGQKISRLSVFVDPNKDTVKVKKQIIRSERAPAFYIMLNKPPKSLTTTQDSKGRPTVMDYIKKPKGRLFPVGRLDWDSEGLLILTNDGDFANKALSPRSVIPKTYVVKVSACPKDSHIKKLVQGVTTPVGKKKALFAKKISKKSSSGAWIKIIISEGKKRQIRLMFDKIGFPVRRLKRTAIGRLKLNKLSKGSSISLTEKDINKVFQKPKEIKTALYRAKKRRSISRPSRR